MNADRRGNDPRKRGTRFDVARSSSRPMSGGGGFPRSFGTSHRVAQSLAGVFALLVLGGFVAGMVALFVVGSKNVRRGIVSRGWPSADAVVSKVEMTRHTSRDSRRGTSTTTYHADLTFRYTVNGKEYDTDQVRWGQTLGSGDPAEAVVLALRYPEGRRVSVRFDPSHPEEAVVEPGLTGAAFLLPGAALAFLMFLVPGCFMIWRLVLVSKPEEIAKGPSMGPWMRVFLGIPILMGVAMLWHGSDNLVRASRSRAWSSTSGAWIRDVPTNQVPGIDAVRQHRGFDYVFTYQVEGIARYQCTRWFGQGTATGNNSDAEIDRDFPRGRPLTVYFQPDQPDVAVLRTGIQGFAWILPGAGLGFMLFGILGMVAVGRR